MSLGFVNGGIPEPLRSGSMVQRQPPPNHPSNSQRRPQNTRSPLEPATSKGPKVQHSPHRPPPTNTAQPGNKVPSVVNNATFRVAFIAGFGMRALRQEITAKAFQQVVVPLEHDETLVLLGTLPKFDCHIQLPEQNAFFPETTDVWISTEWLIVKRPSLADTSFFVPWRTPVPFSTKVVFSETAEKKATLEESQVNEKSIPTTDLSADCPNKPSELSIDTTTSFVQDNRPAEGSLPRKSEEENEELSVEDGYNYAFNEIVCFPLSGK